MNISNTDDRQEIYNRKHVSDGIMEVVEDDEDVCARFEKYNIIKNHKNHK